MNRSIKKVVFYVLLMFVGVQTFGQNIVYEQKVQRRYRMFSLELQTFLDLRGKIRIDSDSIVYITKKSSNSKHNFKLKSDQIRKVSRGFSLIFPNIIAIVGPNNEKYLVFTYKRKKIIDTIRANIKKE